MHILIVDDDPLAGEMAAVVLEEQGHTALRVETGAAALAALAAPAAPGTVAVDAVVSDLNMPLMNGLELLAALRRQGHAQPFVLLSGDDPAALLAAHPELSAALVKDVRLFDALPALIGRLGDDSPRPAPDAAPDAAVAAAGPGYHDG